VGKLAPFGRLIHDLFWAGYTDNDIIYALSEEGIEVSEIGLKKYRLRHGMRRRPGRPRALDDKTIDRMRSLRELPRGVLAERFGVSVVTVWKYLK